MTFDPWRGFSNSALTGEWRDKLTEMARVSRGHILKMTSVAASGHPGGSMSSVDVFLMLYNMARVDPRNPRRDDRDRIIISHGHTSPAVYSSLAAAGFFDIVPCLHGFRQAGSPFEGHVEQTVPGVEWDTGNLGQGLSVGIGKALYARLSGQSFHTYVAMGDGEQQKGQISEARRLAAKYSLTNLTAIVDYNRLQISGRLRDVMPQDIVRDWKSDGWHVIEIDGHDFDQIYGALYRASQDSETPFMILARTMMGKGVSFMENKEGYHGAPVKREMLGDALAQLGSDDSDFKALITRRADGPPPMFKREETPFPVVDPGTPLQYGTDDSSDNRSAWGKALLSVAGANMDKSDFVMSVFDCDLAGSVKTAAFAEKYPSNFIQCGISEHNVATTVGSLGAEKALAVWADFAMFTVAETYNQARLNDINRAHVKLGCTHAGVQVGEDGKTHQSIDYFGLFNSTFGWKVITPADPNQTDKVTRYVLSTPGSFAIIMGRSKVPIITDEDGRPFFGEDYTYNYGRMDTLRSGEKVALIAAGNMATVAIEAWNKLNEKDIRVALVNVSDWSDLHADDIQMLARYDHLVTLEDHNVKTGLGTALGVALMESGARCTLTRLGVTEYASSGKPADLFKMLGLDADSVADRIRQIIGKPVRV
ncbi:MAG: transketolase [candidate division Zixibacteria bacterium]|nr:transketolase [candidate division Zixibacteria bacterium]